MANAKSKNQPSAPESNNAQFKEITQEIYKRNHELAVVNKTLSLLRKLYQISLQALNPSAISEKMSETVRVDLNLEMVGVFLLNDESTELKPFKFSKSDRLADAIVKARPDFTNFKISFIDEHKIVKAVVLDKKPALDSRLSDIWGHVIGESKLNRIAAASHISTVMAFPLISQSRTIGMLVLGLNREYSTLTSHEQDSINSLIDVVAVALDNALLYEKLQETNKQLVLLDKARAEFISIASHQLRTPPATVKWYLAAVLGGDYGQIEEKTKTALERAQSVNNNLISLIDDMLNASRIERGKMEFLFEDTDIKQLVDDVISVLIPQSKMHNLKFSYTPPNMKIPHILADKEKLKQVVNNLIDNALKYTKKGSVTVVLSADQANIHISVKDTGVGLSREDTKKIFEKYGRGKDSKKQSSGLGLGLYVAKVIAEHHRGSIVASSLGPGKGSTFTVTLPIKTDLKAETFDLTQEVQA
jgi:signal transduction histidine kinase